MTVIIMYRNWYNGGDGWLYHPLTVTIADTCPVCGGPRGEPRGHNFIEDGDPYHVNVWTNPCGHIDSYRDVFFEWRASRQQEA